MNNTNLSFVLISLGLVVVVGSIIFFGWLPVTATFPVLQSEQVTAEQELLSARSRRQSLRALVPQRTALEETAAALEEDFLPNEEALELILELETIAEEEGTELGIQFPETVPSTTFQADVDAATDGALTPVTDPLATLPVVPVELKIVGSYQQIVKTIERVEQLSTLGEVLRISFASVNNAPGATDTRPSATITARFFLSPSHVPEPVTAQ